MDIITVDDYIAEVDADAELDAPVNRYCFSVVGQRADLGIGRIVLVPLYLGFDVIGRHDAHLMTE